MSSINKLIANVKKTSSLTSSFINNDSSYICIDTSTNRIGFNTQYPSYSIHVKKNNGIICVSNILLSNLTCDNSGSIRDLSCRNFDVSFLKVDSSFILTATECTISCDFIDFCNSILVVSELSVNNELSVDRLKYKTLEKITVDGVTDVTDNFDKVEINDCSINKNLDISGTFTFHMQSDNTTLSNFNCFNADTCFNHIKTQNITCDYEISCNDICCNDLSSINLYVSNIVAHQAVLERFVVTRDISCRDISCIELSCNDICCNDLSTNKLFTLDISCNNIITTDTLIIKNSLDAIGENITIRGVQLENCEILNKLSGMPNSIIDISRSQLIIPDIPDILYVNVNDLRTGSIYFDSSLQSIKVIHNYDVISDVISDESYNIFYNKKFVNVELSYNNMLPNNVGVINNRTAYQAKIDRSYTDFNQFNPIRELYVNFISTNTNTNISYLNIPLDISYNKANVNNIKFYDISDAFIHANTLVNRIQIKYEDFIDDTITLTSNQQLFTHKNIFFNINAYVTLKYFNQYPNDVEVISYDFEMMNTTGAIEGDILTKSKNTIISFDNSYNYSTSNLNYVGKLKNGTLVGDINSYIYFRIKTENNKDISNLLLYDFNCSVVQI